ncbi:MAG TPA: hypothetical protein VFV67_19970 [Actinophytocola sp.]|uniref:hypothetical protein n=1 Tax=Actinophytocola sp. TaxID=1872138 RepID=UPI002DBCBEF6|nr:hypothetical protein [Actinophytocola sp.]HEU5472928.1 hypothetical protein [Actinophytocola sp.]
MGLASVVAAGAGGAAADPAGGTGRPIQRLAQDLAASALQGVLHTANPRVIDEAIRQAHRTVADQATRAPDRPASASVVFDAGMTSADLTGFVGKHGLDLYAVEAKVPVAASGDVYTMWFNDVARVAGTPAQQLDRLIGSTRLRYFQQAQTAAVDQRAATRELATGAYHFYRAEVVATNTRLAALVGAPSVRAVLPDAGDSKVTGLREAQAAARAIESAAPVTEIRLDAKVSDSAQRGAPVATNTGQSCYWQSAGTLACRTGARGPISGDPAVDAALPRTEGSMVAGSNTSAPSAGVMDDSSLWTGCNNSSDNQACPNDHTYRPHAATGGFQAFGVSIANYRANEVLYICYAYWVPDPNPDGTGGYWQISCYPYAIVTAAFTYGAARWDSRWGTQVTNIAASNQNRPISTLAYKFVDGLQPCVVQQFLATAECSRALQNSVWVSRTGMEDELLIGNPACNPPFGGRTGEVADRSRGCFEWNYAVTTLPAPFVDTTFGDGQQYNLAIASTSPASIVEGRQYSSYAEFWAYGNNNMIGQQAWHSVAVDSRVDEAAICRARNNANPFCYFPVDASRVSQQIPFQ